MQITKNFSMLEMLDGIKTILEEDRMAVGVAHLNNFFKMLDSEHFLKISFDTDIEKEAINTSEPRFELDKTTGRILGVSVNKEIYGATPLEDGRFLIQSDIEAKFA